MSMKHNKMQKETSTKRLSTHMKFQNIDINIHEMC